MQGRQPCERSSFHHPRVALVTHAMLGVCVKMLAEIACCCSPFDLQRSATCDWAYRRRLALILHLHSPAPTRWQSFVLNELSLREDQHRLLKETETKRGRARRQIAFVVTWDYCCCCCWKNETRFGAGLAWNFFSILVSIFWRLSSRARARTQTSVWNCSLVLEASKKIILN